MEQQGFDSDDEINYQSIYCSSHILMVYLVLFGGKLRLEGMKEAVSLIFSDIFHCYFFWSDGTFFDGTNVNGLDVF